jgi:hypothetical protein
LSAIPRILSATGFDNVALSHRRVAPAEAVPRDLPLTDASSETTDPSIVPAIFPFKFTDDFSPCRSDTWLLEAQRLLR